MSKGFKKNLPHQSANLTEFLSKLIGIKEYSSQTRQEMQKAFSLLEMLDLSTSDSETARRRLTNAERYLASNELGAAKHEIKVLEKLLRES